MAEAKHKASSIVLGRVTEIRQAPDTVHEVEGEPDGVVRLPSQRITLEVLRSYKGKVGSLLVVDHFGTDTYYIEDDPPYAVGETYILFVEPKEPEPGTYFVISSPGRYRVVENKLEVMPEVKIPFAKALQGKEVTVLEQALATTP